MGVFKTFSKRKKEKENSGKTDVFQYENFPSAFKEQVIHIWGDSLGRYNNDSLYDTQANRLWSYIHDTLSREFGLRNLGPGFDIQDQCINFFTSCNDEKALDMIDFIFDLIHTVVRDLVATAHFRAIQNPDDAIKELNTRFLEHGLGFEFIDGQLIQIDSQLIHTEVVKNALSLIHQQKYAGVEDEFHKAYEHYRNGDHKEALNECLKALESTMKSICDEKRWEYPKNANSKKLLDTLFENELIPPELQTHYSGIRSALEAGIPTVRNRQSAHGQGLKIQEVPAHLVSFILHSTAASIVFFIKAASIS